MRKWLSVLFLFLLISFVSENTVVSPEPPKEQVSIKTFAHGDGA